MKVKVTEEFDRKFFKQLAYIHDDKPGAASKFKNDIFKLLKKLPLMPYKNRQSIYYNNTFIRELTFKGYIIIYRIKEHEQEIEVFGFIKYIDKP